MRFHAPRIHVVLKKEDIAADVVAGRIAIVLDVMFATSTIVAALAAGAREVVPAVDPVEARLFGASREAGSYVLAGESNLDLIPGFAPPYPRAIAAHGIAGRSLIYSTTNGTVALRACEPAERVYAAALLNAPATAAHVAARHPDRDWVIVCAGSRSNANMEDLYGAGCLVDAFARVRPGRWDLSDNATEARTIFRACEPLACLRESRLGRIVADLGQEAEIDFSARVGSIDLVCPMQDGSVRSARAGGAT
jgi:2-phosphosulfolactate phosphatase